MIRVHSRPFAVHRSPRTKSRRRRHIPPSEFLKRIPLRAFLPKRRLLRLHDHIPPVHLPLILQLLLRLDHRHLRAASRDLKATRRRSLFTATLRNTAGLLPAISPSPCLRVPPSCLR